MADQYDPGVALAGAGEAVVLVPGLDGTGQLFYRQVPLLARTHRVATYALRNSARTMGQLVDDLVGVVVKAGSGRPATIIGESFGGALAMSLALTHPEHVRELVVLNSFPYFAQQFRLRLAIAGLHAIPWGTMSFVRRLTAFRMHSPHTHRREIERFLALTAKASGQGYVSRLRILRQFDIRARLDQIQPPTLFLAADQDHLVPSVIQAHQMAARVPHSTMRTLTGHGHICLIAPDIDLAALLDAWRRQRS